MERPERTEMLGSTSPGADHRRRDATGQRIVAALIDFIPMIGLFALMVAAFGDVNSGGGQFSVDLSGGPLILCLVLSLAYYVVLEALTGRTVGKMIMGLEVVSLDGEPYGLTACLIRNVLRIVDVLPVFYLVGLICVAATSKKQRLGDLAAGTVVVEAR
jgi:uncharacterized RDD family membrane protein YckC